MIIQRIQDPVTGKWKVYGYYEKKNISAWIWSSYVPVKPVWLIVEKSRGGTGFLDWLIGGKRSRERCPSLIEEQLEYERCRDRDDQEIKKIISSAL